MNYGRTAQQVRASLKAAGALAAVSWTPAPASDDPDAPTPAPVTGSAWGVILDYNYKQVGTEPDSLIQVGDRQVLLSAINEATGQPLPLIPPEASIVAPDGLAYTVKAIKPLNPAGVVVMFDLTVRR